ncbi:DNA polymerase IV [Reichenbachiella sp. MALMAid0571]|uniref:DNA polymerase IV n=1 Tax=Reichenbachiella sp. MALMAid0571 TaxID=3143939 RepID=UPI0032DE6533
MNVDQADGLRKIIHIDMDAFFASVEQRDNPDLKGKPVAVGGSRQRGVVAAASYEARRYGVHSALASVTAYRRCPNIIFVPPRFDVYKKVSEQIREIFLDYTDLVEPLSLDEAYLDVTSNKKGMPSATLIAKEIRARIKETTNLTASAGISINKFLAKTASDINKPNGLTLIKPDEATSFIEKLKIEKFHGIGKVTAKKMSRMGIHCGLDLKSKSLSFLQSNFGKTGKYYYNIARAIDEREVNPNRIRKSVSVENTFDYDIVATKDIIQELEILSDSLFSRIEKSKSYGRTLTIKFKFDDFTQITRSKTSFDFLRSKESIINLMKEIVQTETSEFKPIRLLGIGISNLEHEGENHYIQLTLDF